jgi:hypothetical protein
MNKNNFLKLAQRWSLAFIIAVFAADMACGQSNVTAMISIQADQPGVQINSNLSGIFLRKSTAPAMVRFMWKWCGTVPLKNPATLQETTNVLGPWASLNTGVGLIRIPASQTSEFFRLTR